jgi:type IV pilus assembly protein PilP
MSMLSMRIFLFAVLTVALVLPVGCGGGGSTDTPTTRPSARPKRVEAPEEVVEEPEEEAAGDAYSYVSIGKRDPFRSFIQKEVVVQGDGGPVGPLQLHEIDAYRLRGIVWNINQPRAMVEDPAGIGHVVELGTLIGKNWGKVTQIKPTELIITEEYRDPIENELIINEVTMRLPNPDKDAE